MPPDVDITDLKLSAGTLVPAFDPAVTCYEVQVPYDISSITVTCTPTAGVESIDFDPAPTLALVPGENELCISVRAGYRVYKNYLIMITRSAVPLLVWSSHAANPDYLTSRMGLAVGGGHLYLSGGIQQDSRIHIFDISSPGSPIWVSTLRTDFWGGSGLEVSADGNYLFAPEGTRNGLYDVRDKARPVMVSGQTVCGTNKFKDCLCGNRFASIHQSKGFYLYDVTRPSTPVLKCDFVQESPAYPYSIAMSGDKLALACLANGGNKGLYLYSIVDPGHPRLLARNSAWECDCVAMRNNLVYVSLAGTEAQSSPTLHVLDASGDLSRPLHTMTGNDFIVDLYADEDVLIASMDYSGVNLYSLADPVRPKFLVNFGRYRDTMYDPHGGSRAYKVVRSGRLVYVSYEDYGVRIFDIGAWL